MLDNKYNLSFQSRHSISFIKWQVSLFLPLCGLSVQACVGLQIRLSEVDPIGWTVF